MERTRDETLTTIYDDKTFRCIEKEFSRLRDEHYLDHAGTTLYSDTQMKKVSNDLLTSLYANPHSAGIGGTLSQEIIERTRYRILDHFHASSDEYSLVFTSGATAALKIVAETFKFKEDTNSTITNSGNFVYMQDNHTSVLGMRDVVAQKGAKISCLEHKKAFDTFSSNFKPEIVSLKKTTTNSLFVYSAQCNFSGLKYPLHWIKSAQDGILKKITGQDSENWYVLLDAASYVPTNDLDLSIVKPDFVCLSFYKIFGYPTGVGALLVKKSSAHVIEKIYYGGGTVNLAMSLKNFHIKRDVFHERFEDGTLPFLSIISLQHGLDALNIVPMETISKHVFSLARYLHHSLMRLHHRNDKPVARIYCDTDYDDRNLQGGIVAFNLLRSTGDYVGYTEVVHMAALFKIHLRTGCFCNPGTCQRHLGLTNRDVMQNYDAGYTCGGTRDLIDGKPTGAVRISFGYMSTRENVDAVLLMIRKCFLDGPEIIRIPNWFIRLKANQKKKFYDPEARIELNNGIVSHDEFVNNNSLKDKESKENGDNDFQISEERIPRGIAKNRENLKLERLFIYPIKSCAAYEITDSWLLGNRGLQYDREWMIVTSAGVCLSQKQLVNLCLLTPKICKEKNILVLSYPGMPTAEVRLDFTSEDTIKGELCRSRVCGHRVEGIDCGAEISEWLSLALGRPNLRLIRQNNKKNVAKGIRPNFTVKHTLSTLNISKPELSFSSQGQYLLINESSIKWIMERLPKDSDCQCNTILYRFRGNMVLSGSAPFRETNWSRIQIGKHIFEVDGSCTRCQMVCIDQTTGKKTVEPLRLLAEEFRGKLQFGIYLSRQRGDPAIIKIGDPIICV